MPVSVSAPAAHLATSSDVSAHRCLHSAARRRHIMLPRTCLGHVQIEHPWKTLRCPALSPRRSALSWIGCDIKRRICLTVRRRVVYQLPYGSLFTQRHQQFANLRPLLPNAIPPLFNTRRPLSTRLTSPSTLASVLGLTIHPATMC